MKTYSEREKIKEVLSKISDEMRSRLEDVSRDRVEDHENLESLLEDIEFYLDTLKDGETYADFGKRFINKEIRHHEKILKEYRH